MYVDVENECITNFDILGSNIGLLIKEFQATTHQ